jgi:hypothetical protein
MDSLGYVSGMQNGIISASELVVTRLFHPLDALDETLYRIALLLLERDVVRTGEQWTDFTRETVGSHRSHVDHDSNGLRSVVQSWGNVRRVTYRPELEPS